MLQQPPLSVRIEDGDNLTLWLTSNRTQDINLHARVLTDTGKIAPLSILGSALGTRVKAATRSEALQAGYLLSIGVSTIPDVTTPTRGSVWVEVTLDRGRPGTTRAVLIADYLTGNKNLGWPGGIIHDSVEGFGVLVDNVSADPAAGSEVAEFTVPDNAMWVPLMYSVSLAQGATQTPRPALDFRDSVDNLLQRIPLSADLAASTTVQCSWARGAVQNANNVTGGSMSTALPDILMVAGDDVVTSTDGIGANSDYGIARFRIMEYMMNVATQ